VTIQDFLYTYGERYSQACIVGTVQYGGGSVMIWAGITSPAKTELVHINGGRLTAHRYITEVLELHVVPFAPYIGDNFIYMQDSARPHIAGIVNQYFDQVGIVRMNWPARSPDLNPIEHLWDIVGRKIRNLQQPPATLPELRLKLTQVWEEFEQEEVRNVIDSMPRRMRAVINARGGNTSY
jgi:hypothetical protein